MSKTVECPKCGEPMDVPAYPGDGPFELLRSETDGLCIYDHGNDLIRPLNNLLPVTEAEAVAICAALNHVAALDATQEREVLP